MPTQEAFRKKFDRLVDIVWTLQYRIRELEEFEKQWQALFEILKAKTNTECKVRILNWEIYRSFRWDKYHILVSDLLSAIENELQLEDSACRQSIHFLEIHPVEHYINPNQRVTFLDNPDFQRSEEEKQKRIEEIKLSNAQTYRKHVVEAMQNLFLGIGDSDATRPTEANLETLKVRLRGLRDEIYSLRQVFAHKHQERVVEKHSAGIEAVGVEKPKEVTKAFFEIVQKIGLINHGSGYSEFSSANCERTVQDQIDLILFGSINSMHVRFYEVAQKDDFYWQAREKFFSSDSLLSIISKDKESD